MSQQFFLQSVSFTLHGRRPGLRSLMGRAVSGEGVYAHSTMS